MDPSVALPPLLGPDDPPVVEWVNAEGRAPILVLGDHAGRAVPARLARLGLGAAAFERHVAYDIGVDAMARRMAELLDAPALLHRYSRLVLDPNREPDDPTSICAISDGIVVPGNRQLTTAERVQRVETLFRPYHAAIAEQLDRFAAAGVTPAIISLHSFTPAMRDGHSRPWHVGVLWDGTDPRLPVPLLDVLRRDTALCIGDNQPYDARNAHGFTTEYHARDRGLPHVLIEVRQDLIGTDSDAAAWGNRLVAALQEPLAALVTAG